MHISLPHRVLTFGVVLLQIEAQHMESRYQGDKGRLVQEHVVELAQKMTVCIACRHAFCLARV